MRAVEEIRFSSRFVVSPSRELRPAWIKMAAAWRRRTQLLFGSEKQTGRPLLATEALFPLLAGSSSLLALVASFKKPVAQGSLRKAPFSGVMTVFALRRWDGRRASLASPLPGAASGGRRGEL